MIGAVSGMRACQAGNCEPYDAKAAAYENNVASWPSGEPADGYMGVVEGTKFAEGNAELLGRLPGTLGPLGGLPGVSDIAEAVAFLASDRARFITGEVLNVAGGAYMRNQAYLAARGYGRTLGAAGAALPICAAR
jgi:hypothetical protein